MRHVACTGCRGESAGRLRCGTLRSFVRPSGRPPCAVACACASVSRPTSASAAATASFSRFGPPPRPPPPPPPRTSHVDTAAAPRAASSSYLPGERFYAAGLTLLGAPTLNDEPPRDCDDDCRRHS